MAQGSALSAAAAASVLESSLRMMSGRKSRKALTGTACRKASAQRYHGFQAARNAQGASDPSGGAPLAAGGSPLARPSRALASSSARRSSSLKQVSVSGLSSIVAHTTAPMLAASSPSPTSSHCQGCSPKGGVDARKAAASGPATSELTALVPGATMAHARLKSACSRYESRCAYIMAKVPASAAPSASRSMDSCQVLVTKAVTEVMAAQLSSSAVVQRRIPMRRATHRLGSWNAMYVRKKRPAACPNCALLISSRAISSPATKEMLPRSTLVVNTTSAQTGRRCHIARRLARVCRPARSSSARDRNAPVGRSMMPAATSTQNCSDQCL
mmetsp:Transcript_16786/g.42094  ORF Transcript_16786/g.42094 Transcript_16786/m.42094 type:complete len:329 (-) Transcript_16786:35-1021(-)